VDDAAFPRPWPGEDVAGALSLGLANTLDWRLREEPLELLSSFEALLRWARTAGILDASEADTLREWGATHPRAAKRALADAIGTREVIAAVAGSLARGEAPAPAAIARLDELGRRAVDARRLRPDGTGAAWGWHTLDADRPALGAALDAIRLLTSPEREKVRQCADAQCGWFFLDTSRNGARRWCSMKECGNRNKARRHRRRRSETGT